jgi:hypothetical protein
MKFGVERKGFEEAIRELDKLAKAVNPEELLYWTKNVEATAKKLCEDSKNKIVFKHIEGKKMEFSVEDKKSRDCLVKAIESHFDSMPFFVQGYFSVVKYRLANLEQLNQ